MEQITNEAVEKRAGGARRKKGGGIGGPLLIALGLTAAIAGGAYLGLCAYVQNSAAIWKNTYVLEQDIGGLTVEEAVEKVTAALPELEIGIRLYDVSSGPADTASPDGADAAIPLSELGAEVDVSALVTETAASAKSGPFYTAGWRYLSNMGDTYYDSASHIRLDSGKAARAADRVAGELSWPALDTAYSVEENALLVRTAMDGRFVDGELLRDTLEERSWAGRLMVTFPARPFLPQKPSPPGRSTARSAAR